MRAATWLTHLDFDWESPVWRHWLEGLGETHTVIRYDERGCGLSDRDVGDLSVETWVADLETVVDAAGVDRFALLGVSQGAAIALAYAVRHPERVTHLVLYGGYARGRKFRNAGERRHEDALISAIRAGWSDPNATFRHVFSMLFLPTGTSTQMAWYDELQRRSTSAETAARLYDARGSIDVAHLAPRVTTKTLVMHAREDRVVPVEEGRLLGAQIPDARLVLLDSANHISSAHRARSPSNPGHTNSTDGIPAAASNGAAMRADGLVAVVDREQVGASRRRGAVQRGEVLVQGQRPPPRRRRWSSCATNIRRVTNSRSGSAPGASPK